MDRYFISRSHVNDVRRFNERFRNSLLNLGKSPDMHVYEINEASLAFVRRGEDYAFVLSVASFYNNLGSEIKKRIFITEIMERGRHYPFWHYGVMDTPDYRDKVEEIFKAFSRVFLEAAS